MRPLFASLLMLLAATSAQGQAAPPASNSVEQSPTFLQGIPPGQFHLPAVVRRSLSAQLGCPVGFSAQRRADPVMRRTDESDKKGPAQGLFISLDRRGAPEIESVEVTVYGVTSRLMVLPAGVRSADEVSKTFLLHRTKESDDLQDASIWMHGIASFTRVRLNSITYADGSTWHESNTYRCQAVPSSLLLIANK